MNRRPSLSGFPVSKQSIFNEQNVSSTVSTSPQGLGQAAGPGNVRLGLQQKTNQIQSCLIASNSSIFENQ
jgi:hypothetical protein